MLSDWHTLDTEYRDRAAVLVMCGACLMHYVRVVWFVFDGVLVLVLACTCTLCFFRGPRFRVRGGRCTGGE